MKHLILIMLSFLFFGTAVFAKLPTSKTKRKPSQAASIQILVRYGEKESSFDISKSPNGSVLRFANNEGLRKSRTVPNGDFEYLKNRLRSIKGLTNQLEYCHRNHISVVNGPQKLLGCIGSNNSVAKELQEIVNLLVVYL